MTKMLIEALKDSTVIISGTEHKLKKGKTLTVDVPDFSKLTSLLAEREVTHGNYTVTATVAQEIKDTIRGYKDWQREDPVLCESLDLIATKLARIVSGNPREADHWRDIIGYAELALDHINRERMVEDAKEAIPEA